MEKGGEVQNPNSKSKMVHPIEISRILDIKTLYTSWLINLCNIENFEC